MPYEVDRAAVLGIEQGASRYLARSGKTGRVVDRVSFRDNVCNTCRSRTKLGYSSASVDTLAVFSLLASTVASIFATACL